MSLRRPAVFVARDALLSEGARDGSAPRFSDDVVLRRDAAPFVRALNELGYLCLVLAHEPRVARGVLTLAGLERIHAQLRDDLWRGGAALAGIHVCPHDPEAGASAAAPGIACGCRRPAPGLLLMAAAEHHVELRRSFLVAGDADDLEAGRRAGVRTIRIGAAGAGPAPEWSAANLHGALALIAGEREREAEVRARR